MPTRTTIAFDSRIKETLDALHGPGLLLVTQGSSGQPNAMTIGWGSIGVIWGLPVFQILVRPSRFSYELLTQNGDFTVNIMPDARLEDLTYCGTASGRDGDKLAHLGLTAQPGPAVRTPYLAQSEIAFECRTVMTAEVAAERLDPTIIRGAYRSGDFHRIHFGHILATHSA